MSGKISAKPPFELPTEDGSQTEECSAVQLHVHEGQQEDISSENLKSIHCIYQHSFAQRTFLWAAVSLYEDCCYDSTSGLWCSKDSVGQTVPVLIRYLSHPLTVAADGNLKIWFLDVFHLSTLEFCMKHVL